MNYLRSYFARSRLSVVTLFAHCLVTSRTRWRRCRCHCGGVVLGWRATTWTWILRRRYSPTQPLCNSAHARFHTRASAEELEVGSLTGRWRQWPPPPSRRLVVCTTWCGCRHVTRPVQWWRCSACGRVHRHWRWKRCGLGRWVRKNLTHCFEFTLSLHVSSNELVLWGWEFLLRQWTPSSKTKPPSHWQTGSPPTSSHRCSHSVSSQVSPEQKTQHIHVSFCCFNNKNIHQSVGFVGRIEQASHFACLPSASVD